MRFMKPVVWIIVGVVIGAFSSAAVSTVWAKQNSTARKLIYVQVPVNGTMSAGFLRDTQSGGCWLLFSDTASTPTPPTALVVAPEAACK